MSKEAKSKQKKQYEKPAIIHRQALEGVATICDENANGKGGGDCTVLNS